MPNLWEAPTWIKIHETCGGRVRWVEAIDTPGVGYTGECIRCGAERVHQEGIIPLYDGDDRVPSSSLHESYDEMDAEAQKGLRWDDDASHDENQQRLRKEVIAASEGF